MSRIAMIVLAFTAFWGIAGCNTDAMFDRGRSADGPTTRLDAPQGVDVPSISIVDRNEVDLVEEMAMHRAMYQRTLALLRDYYRERGYVQKNKWAEYELADVGRIKPFKYLLSAEIPSDTFRPTESIAEANALYDKGVELMKNGGHGVPVFYREGIMKDALKNFVELVKRYPTSDKIDDAAFLCGEIYKEYFRDQETIAVGWYQRAIEWDPKTPHPARFELAVVYDFRLHDRAKALEWYRACLDEEQNIDQSNVAFSMRRIDELVRPRDGAAPTQQAAVSTSHHTAEATAVTSGSTP